MAAETSALGHFLRLPYEIREQIWMEFAPAGHDTKLARIQKADLSILCTSRALYDEISRLIYLNSRLEFDIWSYYDCGNTWITVYFKNGCHQQNVNDNVKDTQARWKLRSLADARSRGFHHLPFHKIDDVVVNLFAPNPKRSNSLFWLWRRVTDLVSLLKEAPVIRNLIIRLLKSHDQDWFYCIGANRSSSQMDCADRYDHDVVVVPFCTLRNLEDIDVEAHSMELEEMMDWTIINWAMSTVWDRSWNHCISSKYTGDEIAEHDVDRKVAGDYFWIHRELWNHPEGIIANMMRRTFLSNWYVQGSSGYSEFEEKILQIINVYPEVFEAYDPKMLDLQEMTKALVCLYHRARSLCGKRNMEEPNHWDQAVWDSAFPWGIPAACSQEFEDEIKDLLDWDIYFDYVEEGSIFSTIDRVQDEWESRKINPKPTIARVNHADRTPDEEQE